MARYVELNQSDWVLPQNQSTGLREEGGRKASPHLKKMVCCWVLRLIGGERFDRRQGSSLVFVLGSWLILRIWQAGVVGAHSKSILMHNVFKCCGKYCTKTFRTHYRSHNVVNVTWKLTILFNLSCTGLTFMGHAIRGKYWRAQKQCQQLTIKVKSSQFICRALNLHYILISHYPHY